MTPQRRVTHTNVIESQFYIFSGLWGGEGLGVKTQHNQLQLTVQVQYYHMYQSKYFSNFVEHFVTS